MTKLSKSLADLRKAKKLSQAQVAEKLFVTPQAVSRWERGETEPDVETLVKIAQIYGVGVSELVGEDNPKPNSKLEKAFHLITLISSIVLIVFSIVSIVLSFTLKQTRYLFYIFVTIAILYLILIMVIELRKEFTKKKPGEEKKDEKKHNKAN